MENTISASRVAAMLGLDPHHSPLSLHLSMRGVLGDAPDNEAMMEGRFYERATADIACAKYGMEIVPGYEQMEMQAGPLSGHPDFVVIDENGELAILEVKNPFHGVQGDEWGDPGSDAVPRGYFLQAQTYLHLFLNNQTPEPQEKAQHAYLVARLRGGVVRYKIPYDPDIVAKIQSEAEAFLANVAADNPPTPQDEQDQRNRWTVTEGKAVECDIAFVEQLRALASLKGQIKALTQQESELKMMILGYAQDAERIDFTDPKTGVKKTLVTLAASRKFDEEACLASHPDLLAKGYAKLNVSKLAKEQKALHEMFMRKPENAVEQTRVIRLREKELTND